MHLFVVYICMYTPKYMCVYVPVIHEKLYKYANQLS